jgi:hypothetical protein
MDVPFTAYVAPTWMVRPSFVIPNVLMPGLEQGSCISIFRHSKFVNLSRLDVFSMKSSKIWSSQHSERFATIASEKKKNCVLLLVSAADNGLEQ